MNDKLCGYKRTVPFGIIGISVSAHDNINVHYMQIFIDDEIICNNLPDQFTPTCNWKVTKTPGNKMIIKVVAGDGSGNSGKYTREYKVTKDEKEVDGSHIFSPNYPYRYPY